jgi:hypothetical protein
MFENLETIPMVLLGQAIRRDKTKEEFDASGEMFRLCYHHRLWRLQHRKRNKACFCVHHRPI